MLPYTVQDRRDRGDILVAGGRVCVALTPTSSARPPFVSVQLAESLPPLLWHTELPTLQQWLDVLWWQWQEMMRLRIFDKPLASTRGLAADGRDEAFWHLITTDPQGSGQRTLDLYRGAMLGRVWQVLEWTAAEDPRALWWHEEKHGTRELVVVPADYSLSVVLRERRGSFSLVTAYPAGKPRDVRRLRAREAACASSAPAARSSSR